MTTGIYKIINIFNRHQYIGSAKNIKDRWGLHVRSLENGKHHSRYLQRAWNKYGASNFEFRVIEECAVNELITREQFWIDELKPEYNVSKIAGSRLGVKAGPETVAKMIGNKNAFGAIRSPETRKKMSKPKSESMRAKLSEIARNRIYTPERRANMSKARKGIKQSPETVAKRTISNIGKKRSDEIRAKFSEIKSNQSDETRAKIRAGLKAFWQKKKEKQDG